MKQDRFDRMENRAPIPAARPPGMFYVCDSCGHIEVRDQVPEGDVWTCENCGSHSAWEFPPSKRANAETHAAHIANFARSGLFHQMRRQTP